MTYTLLKFVHVLGAILIGVGLISVWLSDLRSRQLRELPQFAEAVRNIAVFYDGVVVPGAVLLLGSVAWLIAGFYAMYYNDHAPPYFHARYGAFEAAVAIDTGEVVEGRLPPRVLGLVQEWCEYHKAELTEDWNLARERKTLKRIEPLE